MPIANCIITAECSKRSGNLIELWSKASGISSKHMTINIVTSSEQLGNQYKVMAHLWLPSIWPTADISSLQLGLAKALSKHFSLAIHDVHVITMLITSGLVVESGQEMIWSS
jgi:hypothetical protein